jgi:hypothetical protein
MGLELGDLVHMSADGFEDLKTRVYQCTMEYRSNDLCEMDDSSDEGCFPYVSGRLGISIDVIECIIYGLDIELMILWRRSTEAQMSHPSGQEILISGD